MKLWDYLPQRVLQSALDAIHPGLLQRLEVIIPAVTAEPFNPTQLYTTKQLTKVLDAFLDGSSLRQGSFLSSCLQYVPQPELDRTAAALGIRSDLFDFDSVAAAIIGKVRSSKTALGSFIDLFHLPDHYNPAHTDMVPGMVSFGVASQSSPIEVFSPYKPLKDYQFGVYLLASERLRVPFSRFLIQMPTGSGKTRTAMEIACDYLNTHAPGTVIVWLAHSEELCEQAFQCFCETWAHTARQPLQAFRAWGSHPLPLPAEGQSTFIVAGFQKLARMMARDPAALQGLSDRTGLIIIDEAHRTTAPTFQSVVEALISAGTQVVGLTATPGRSNEHETADLSGFYFSTHVGIPVAPDQSVIGMLRKAKVLSKVENIELKSHQSYTLSPRELGDLEQDLDFPPDFLKRVGADDVRNIEVIKRLISECKKGGRIVFFACNVAHSKFITAVLLYFGISSAHLDGKTDRAMRRKIIEDFRSNRLQVLCNVGILSTGFDAPNTDVVFIARPTNSVVLYSQMIGRGLRGPAIGGTPSCRIINTRDNIQGFGDADMIYNFFEEYFHS